MAATYRAGQCYVMSRDMFTGRPAWLSARALRYVDVVIVRIRVTLIVTRTRARVVVSYVQRLTLLLSAGV